MKLLIPLLCLALGCAAEPPSQQTLQPDPSANAAPETIASKPVLLKDRENEEIDVGSLVLRPRTRDLGLSLENLSNCTIRFQIDYDPPPFTQGTISSLEPLEIVIDPGYPVPDNSWCDRGGGNSKTIAFRNGEMLPQPLDWAASLKQLPSGIIRLKLRRGSTKHLALGDQLVLPDRHFASAVRVIGCKNCTLEGTIYASPNVGVIEHEGTGNTYRLNILPKPESTRLLSTNADAFHSRESQGTQLLDCHFSSSGDDAINIHSSLAVVVGREGERLLVLAPHKPVVGKAVAIGRHFTDPQPLDFTDVALPDNESVARAHAHEFGILPAVVRRNAIYSVASSALPVPGTILSQDAKLPRNVSISNTRCDHSFGGIKLKCSGQVENLRFEDCLGVLHIGADLRWLEGPIPHDISLENVQCNRIFRAGRWGDYSQALSFVNYDDRPGTKVNGIELREVFLDGVRQ